MLLAWILSAAGCVPAFLMLSGYLCSGKKLCAHYYAGILRVLVPYFFASLLCLVFREIYYHQQMDLRYILSSIVNFYACEYAWYLMLYIGLFLMIPFLNIMYYALGTRRRKLGLIATFFALSILPSLLNSYIQLCSVWWKNLYPITYYLIGAYLGEYKPRLSSGKALLLCCALLALFGVYDVFHLARDGSLVPGIGYDHHQVMVVGVLLFIALHNLRISKTTGVPAFCIRKLSELSFSIYLLSWVSDGLIYPVLVRLIPEYTARYIWWGPTVALSLLMSAVMSQLMELVCIPCDRALRKLLLGRISPAERKS